MTWADDRVVELEAENIRLKDRLEQLRRRNSKLQRALGNSPVTQIGGPDFKMLWEKWHNGMRAEALKGEI